MRADGVVGNDVPRLGDAYAQADIMMMADMEMNRSLAAARRRAVIITARGSGFGCTIVARFRNRRDRCRLSCVQRSCAQGGDGEEDSEQQPWHRSSSGERTVM